MLSRGIFYVPPELLRVETKFRGGRPPWEGSGGHCSLFPPVSAQNTRMTTYTLWKNSKSWFASLSSSSCRKLLRTGVFSSFDWWVLWKIWKIECRSLSRKILTNYFHKNQLPLKYTEKKSFMKQFFFQMIFFELIKSELKVPAK